MMRQQYVPHDSTNKLTPQTGSPHHFAPFQMNLSKPVGLVFHNDWCPVAALFARKITPLRLGPNSLLHVLTLRARGLGVGRQLLGLAGLHHICPLRQLEAACKVCHHWWTPGIPSNLKMCSVNHSPKVGSNTQQSRLRAACASLRASR